MKKNFVADAGKIIEIENKQYALYSKGHHPKNEKYPCMISVDTGEIPERKQLPLLRIYFQIGRYSCEL